MSDIKDDDEMLKKVDELTNLVEQIFLAHQIGDDRKVWISHEEASKLGFDISNYLQEPRNLTPRAAEQDTTEAIIADWARFSLEHNFQLSQAQDVTRFLRERLVR